MNMAHDVASLKRLGRGIVRDGGIDKDPSIEISNL